MSTGQKPELAPQRFGTLLKVSYYYMTRQTKQTTWGTPIIGEDGIDFFSKKVTQL